MKALAYEVTGLVLIYYLRIQLKGGRTDDTGLMVPPNNIWLLLIELFTELIVETT